MKDQQTEMQKQDDLNRDAEIYMEAPCEEALCSVIHSGERLVAYFVRLYGGGRNYEDLRQAGMEGLLKAAKGFDPGKGASFTTYAGHCIMGEMRHYLRQEAAYYKPGCIKDLQSRVGQVVGRILTETGRVPDLTIIADKLNIKEESIAEVMKAGLVNFEEVDLAKIGSTRYESFVLPIEDRIVLHQAYRKLSALQKKVIYLLMYRDLTQEQAAKKLGLNQKKVSRVYRSGLDTLRNTLAEG